MGTAEVELPKTNFLKITSEGKYIVILFFSLFDTAEENRVSDALINFG
jgi:hypothetical protein